MSQSARHAARAGATGLAEFDGMRQLATGAGDRAALREQHQSVLVARVVLFVERLHGGLCCIGDLLRVVAPPVPL